MLIKRNGIEQQRKRCRCACSFSVVGFYDDDDAADDIAPNMRTSSRTRAPKQLDHFINAFRQSLDQMEVASQNVIDALLFVFGKRAKKLRLNKVSELIHNSVENLVASTPK